MTKAIVPPPAAAPVPIRMPGQGAPAGNKPGAADASQWQSVANQVLGPSAFARQGHEPVADAGVGVAVEAGPETDGTVPLSVPQGAARGTATTMQAHGLPLVGQANAEDPEGDAVQSLAALAGQGPHGEGADAQGRLPDLSDSGDPAATSDATGEVEMLAPGSHVPLPVEMLVLSSGMSVGTDPSWVGARARTLPLLQTAGTHLGGANWPQGPQVPSTLADSLQAGTVDLGNMASATQVSGGDLPNQMGPSQIDTTARAGANTVMPDASLPAMAAAWPQPAGPPVSTAEGLSVTPMTVRADGAAPVSYLAAVDGLDMPPVPPAGTLASGDGPSLAPVIIRSEPPGTIAPQAPADLASPGLAGAEMQVGRISDSAIDPLEAMVGSALSSAPSGSSAEALAARAAIPHTATFGQAQVRQVAEMVLHAPRDGVIELTLDPVELGRVRLSLTPGDHVMNVVLAADRPETLELMRRHADALSGALREMGYANVSLDFAGAGSGGQGGNPAAPPPPAADDSAATTGTDTASPLGASQTVATLGGLDLRF